VDVESARLCWNAGSSSSDDDEDDECLFQLSVDASAVVVSRWMSRQFLPSASGAFGTLLSTFGLNSRSFQKVPQLLRRVLLLAIDDMMYRNDDDDESAPPTQKEGEFDTENLIDRTLALGLLQRSYYDVSYDQLVKPMTAMTICFSMVASERTGPDPNVQAQV
jgi:hypothetical protein